MNAVGIRIIGAFGCFAAAVGAIACNHEQGQATSSEDTAISDIHERNSMPTGAAITGAYGWHLGGVAPLRLKCDGSPSCETLAQESKSGERGNP